MKKAQLPVSRKFYDDISNRVNSALSAAPASAVEAMRIVDSYMDGKATASNDAMAMLAFNMVKDEIDRAMLRSQRARQRAKIRQNDATKEKLSPSTVEETDGTPAKEPEAAPARHISRRERRAALNLMRRLKKPRWGAIA